MNKIDKTSERLKKKMSFEDYGKPSSTAKKENDSKTACQLGAQTDKSHTPAPIKEKPTTSTSKKKVTFYLDSQSEDFLTDVFISRLQSRNKSDKSALICEAIELLHKKELLGSPCN